MESGYHFWLQLVSQDKSLSLVVQPCLHHPLGGFQEEFNCRVNMEGAQGCYDTSLSPDTLMWGPLCCTAGYALSISPLEELRPRQRQGSLLRSPGLSGAEPGSVPKALWHHSPSWARRSCPGGE